MKHYGILALMFLTACSSAPKYDPQQVRPWSQEISKEFPNKSVVIAQYRTGEYELFYLTANHTTDLRGPTSKTLDRLFSDFKFNAVLIDSIPYSSGESPEWFLKEARAGKSANFIKMGEAGLAAIYANDRKIPFYAGEPDHKSIYTELKKLGFTDHDILGFYLARQIPQWIREMEEKRDLLVRKGEPFVQGYCAVFAINLCPSVPQLIDWYKTKNDQTITVDITNEELDPLIDGPKFTNRISAQVGKMRDRFTLNVIKELVGRYKKVAVVYGAGHFITLRKSFDAKMGPPQFIE